MKVLGFIKDNDAIEQSSPTSFYFSSIHIKKAINKNKTSLTLI